MNNVFLSFLFGLFILFSANCDRGSAENAETNVNSNIAVNQSENTEQTNLNTANTNSDEVPTYDDAATALADGNKFLDNNENDKAIDAFKQAVELDPELADAHFRLGIALSLVEKEEAATATPEEEETPEKGKKKKNKKEEDAEKTKSQKSFENAVKAYEKITKKEPKNDQAFFNLGRALNKLNEDKDAAKALQTAVKLKPDDTDYQTELGDIYIKLAQYDEAVRALKKAIDLDENNLVAVDKLEQAEAGKKRVDFGANMIKPKIKVEPKPKE